MNYELGHGAWGLEHGAWGLEHGAWGLGQRTWGMGQDLLQYHPGNTGAQICGESDKIDP